MDNEQADDYLEELLDELGQALLELTDEELEQLNRAAEGLTFEETP